MPQTISSTRLAHTPARRPKATALGSLALVAFAALAGCVERGDVTGSIGHNSASPSSATVARNSLDDLAKRYSDAPNDKGVAMAYAAALKTAGRFAEAVAVLENVAVHNAEDPSVLGAYGKALADAGRFQEAERVLENAQSPAHPDWSILSAQGAVQDQLGDHEKAQTYYQTALRIAPGEPGVLSNLGLSYALSKRLDLAEATLRQAAASPRADTRVRQNLALVLALRGKFAEAREVDSADLSPAQADANIEAIRKMIAQSDTWSKIRVSDAAPGAVRTK